MAKLLQVLQDMGRTFPPHQMGGSTEEWLEMERKKIKWYNDSEGSLTGYDCRECKNKGGYREMDQAGRTKYIRCKCMAVRDAHKAMRDSGIKPEVMQACDFSVWETPERWQANAGKMAKEYTERAVIEPDFADWFIMAGTPGSGKTKLCTTVFRQLLEAGIRGRYISWREFAREVKSVAVDQEAFGELVNVVKNIPVLYIDDFWKGNVTQADINLAFEILNSRYAENLRTIISTERTVDNIITIDEAVGSRLFGKSKSYYINCTRAKNWRLQ